MKRFYAWLMVVVILVTALAGCESRHKETLEKEEQESTTRNPYRYRYDEKEANPVSDFSYTLDKKSDSIIITRYKGKSPNVVIPEYIEGKKVTELRGTFYLSTVESVVLSKGIHTIGMQAFLKCENLKSVMLSPNLKTIETEAFSGCTALKELALPDSLEEMGYMAFNGCTALKYVFIPKSIINWDGGATFYQCGLQKVDLEEGMTSLGYMTFSDTQITEITFPKSLKTIPQGVCARCANLTRINLPEGVETIESGAFIKTAITELTIPASVRSVSDTSFYSNEHLKKVTFLGDAPEKFVDDEYNFAVSKGGGDYTIYYQKDAKGFSTPRWCGFKAAPVGSEPQPLMDGDFEYTVNGDGTVTLVSYEGDATNVVVPETLAGKTVTVIGEKAFVFEDEILSVQLPNTVTEIGFGAFAQCLSLTTVNLPENLETIGDHAFNMCDLTEVSFPASLRKIGAYAYSNCQPVEYLYIPASITEIGKNAFMGMGYTNNGWSKGEFELVLEEGIEVIGEWFYGCSMESVVLPSTVKRIEERAFSGCDYLTSITLNEGLLSIGDFAFESCSGLSEIVIPSTVTEVSVLTFDSCSRLKAVKFEGNAPEIFWKHLPDGEILRPAYDVYRHQDATGFGEDNFGWFDEIKIW